MSLSTVSLSLIVTLSLGSAFAAESRRPNIVFLLADDMGYGDAGCYGGKLIRTPHIDSLARDGLRFTQCYAGSTVCAPSRSVLMTGLHTGHTRVRGNFGVGGVVGLGGGRGRVPLRDEDVTVAEILKSAGYVTGMSGKWGLGEPETTGTPGRQGFDTWFGYMNQRRAHSYYPTFLWLNDHKFDLPGNQNGRKQQYSHDLLTGFALNFIRANAKRPFFLYVPYTIPHSKMEIPDLGPYADEKWPEREKAYAAMITRMDEDVGRILKLLKAEKIDKDTIVFFASDNGAASRYDGRFDSSGALRGHKRDMYEGGLRTPMVVRWPGHVPAGKTSDAVWSFADFLATAADLAGVDHSDDTDGVSVLPTLLGKTQPSLDDRFLYWEFFERGFQQAARWRSWKAIRRGKGGKLALYDLSKDLGETTDVAASNPEVVRKFAEFIDTARTESSAWPLR
jgi:arylsulfatase A-like enzyme